MAESAAPRSLESRKLHLIKRLAVLEDEALIRQLEVFLLQEEDWWDQLSEKEKADLQEGWNDLERGRTEAYDDFMTRMDQKFK